jgi:hypothetical protein
MNTNSTLTTALLRGLYVAVVVGLIAGLTVYQQSTDGRNAIITGALSFLGALGVRGGIEGTVDSARQASNNVSPSDVQATTAGKP